MIVSPHVRNSSTPLSLTFFISLKKGSGKHFSKRETQKKGKKAAVPLIKWCLFNIFLCCTASFKVVPSLELFRMNLNAFTKGMLSHVNWDGVVLAGGAVLACAMPLPRFIMRRYRNVSIHPYPHAHAHMYADTPTRMHACTRMAS